MYRSLTGAKMAWKSGASKSAADKLVRNTKFKTREHYAAEEKIKNILARPLLVAV